MFWNTSKENYIISTARAQFHSRFRQSTHLHSFHFGFSCPTFIALYFNSCLATSFPGPCVLGLILFSFLSDNMYSSYCLTIVFSKLPSLLLLSLYFVLLISLFHFPFFAYIPMVYQIYFYACDIKLVAHNIYRMVIIMRKVGKPNNLERS